MRRHSNPQSYSARSERRGYDDAEQPTDRLPAIEPQPELRPEPRPARRGAVQATKSQRRVSAARRGRGMTLVIWLIGLVAVAVILVAGFLLASDNIIKPIVADQVEDDIDSGVERIVGEQLASMPIAPEQPQEIMVSEAELNQRIAEQDDLGPLDGAEAEINSDGIVVHMDAYGLSGKYRAQVGVENGRAVLQNGSISGPLSYVIPVRDLERVANDAIARSLSASAISVTDVTLVDGEMVLTLESTGESTGAGNDAPTG